MERITDYEIYLYFVSVLGIESAKRFYNDSVVLLKLKDMILLESNNAITSCYGSCQK